MTGVYCGPDAILTCEHSSFINLRIGGHAVLSHRPKLIKILNGTVQKCESHGFHIKLEDSLGRRFVDDSTVYEKQSSNHTRKQSQDLVSNTNTAHTELAPTENEEGAKFVRKIFIENNRLLQVQGCPIVVEGNAYYQEYLVRVKDNRISNCGLESKLYAIPSATPQEAEREKALVEKAYKTLGQKPESCILLVNLLVSSVICFRNTISKSSGSGIKVINCKGAAEDPLVDMALPVS